MTHGTDDSVLVVIWIKEFVKDISVHCEAILEVLGLGGGMPSPSALV